MLPDFTGGVGAYALVGMGAAFAGIVRVPLTSVIMIFEMTRDYSIIVPLMISNLISFYISYRLQEEPIYEALQHQDGVHLPSGLRYRQGQLIVRMPPRLPTKCLPGRSAYNALAYLDADRNAWPVMDGGHLAGMITLSQVEKEMPTATLSRGWEMLRRGHSDRCFQPRIFPTSIWITRWTWLCGEWRIPSSTSCRW